MTPEETQMYILKGMLADLSEADRAKVTSCAVKLREAIAECGELGGVALGLVGLEMQMAGDPK